MLAVVPLRHTKDEGHGENIGGFSIGTDKDFIDFSDGNLLDSINFDDIFLDIDYENDLPDLEMDSELLADFSISTDDEESDPNTWVSMGLLGEDSMKKSNEEDEEEDKVSGSSSSQGEEIVSKREKNAATKLSMKENHEKGRSKSSSQGKNSHANKRKVKVDWTPELHRRFVQAVEQLGVDKAVPSRILEIMGIDCLTRHNIASHLQKYRSHRKHLLAREAEAASWSQRRQMYGGTTGGVGKRDMNPWLAPAMGFPPHPAIPPAQPPVHMHHFRPLHVWGHPLDQSLVHMWPKHLAHSPFPPPQRPPSWAPQPPSIDPSFWHPHHQRVSNGLAQGAPCLPPPLPTTRFATPPVQVIPPPAMSKVNSGIGFPAGNSSTQQTPFELHPSKESIDAAIEDVISKPWLPLPLGLKPPSLDGVLVELQRHGVPKIPPTASCS